MRGAWIALCAAIVCVTFAQSQPPAPTPSKQSNPQQQEATHVQQSSADGQRGTENAPFVIKIVNGNKTENGASNAKDESGRKSLIWGMTPDYATGVFTGLLFVIG